MGQWFRFYDEVVDDPKVQRLPPVLFKAWVNLMCMASKNTANRGALPPVDDIAFRLRITKIKVEGLLNSLVHAGLFDWHEGTAYAHNWKSRQFQDSGSTSRVERYREKRRALGLPILADYSQFRAVLIARDGAKCIYCEATEPLVVDHLVPIEQGGTDHYDNLGLACKRCNAGKSGRTPEQAGLIIRVKSTREALDRYLFNRDTVTDCNGYTKVTSPCHQNRTDTEQNRTEQKHTQGKPVSTAEPVLKFGEFLSVTLAESEHEKLRGRIDGNLLEQLIDELDRYSQTDPKAFRKYKNHYAVLLNWATRRGWLKGGSNGHQFNQKARTAEVNLGAAQDFVSRKLAETIRGDIPDVREDAG